LLKQVESLWKKKKRNGEEEIGQQFIDKPCPIVAVTACDDVRYK